MSISLITVSVNVTVCIRVVSVTCFDAVGSLDFVRNNPGEPVPEGKMVVCVCASTLLVGWQEGHPTCKRTEWWGAGMVICLGRGADLLMIQLIPLPLGVSCSRKSRLVLVLPFQYQLTWVVPDKIQCAVKRL